MTAIEVPADLLRRALDGDDTAQQEARALLPTPEQTTAPEDVPPGEAWLVDLNGKRLHAIKDQDEEWYVPEDSRYWHMSSAVTLISPLVPARPIGDEWVDTEDRIKDVHIRYGETFPYKWLVMVDGTPLKRFIELHDALTYVQAIVGETVEIRPLAAANHAEQENRA